MAKPVSQILDYESSPFSLRDSRASETRAHVKITPRRKLRRDAVGRSRLAFLAFRSFYYPE